MLWFINSILHIFGMAIVIEFDEGKAVRAYPARVKCRGFDEKINDLGYYQITYRYYYLSVRNHNLVKRL